MLIISCLILKINHSIAITTLVSVSYSLLNSLLINPFISAIWAENIKSSKFV